MLLACDYVIVSTHHTDPRVSRYDGVTDWTQFMDLECNWPTGV
jgi:hypothetical protein